MKISKMCFVTSVLKIMPFSERKEVRKYLRLQRNRKYTIRYISRGDKNIFLRLWSSLNSAVCLCAGKFYHEPSWRYLFITHFVKHWMMAKTPVLYFVILARLLLHKI